MLEVDYICKGKKRKEVNRICKGIQVYRQRIVNIKSFKKIIERIEIFKITKVDRNC